MDNPDLDKFYTLPEAFNVLGRERYGEEWTGIELEARNRLPPESPPLRAFPAADWKRRKIASFSRAVVLMADKEDYQKESAAYQRRRQVEAELHRILYNKLAPAELLNAHDGVRISVPPAHWSADKFTVSISSGMAEWADQGTSSRPTHAITPPTTYKGLVLIDRHQFDLAIKDYVCQSALHYYVASDKKTTAVADEEISVGAKFPEWWPKKPKTQADWRFLWARALEIEREPANWNISSIAIQIAKKETGAKTLTVEAENRAGVIRKCLGKMRTEDGPPKE